MLVASTEEADVHIGLFFISVWRHVGQFPTDQPFSPLASLTGSRRRPEAGHQPCLSRSGRGQVRQAVQVRDLIWLKTALSASR